MQKRQSLSSRIGFQIGQDVVTYNANRWSDIGLDNRLVQGKGGGMWIVELVGLFMLMFIFQGKEVEDE